MVNGLMVGNGRENGLKVPNSSKSLPNCPKMSQNVHFRRIVVRTHIPFFIPQTLPRAVSAAELVLGECSIPHHSASGEASSRRRNHVSHDHQKRHSYRSLLQVLSLFRGTDRHSPVMVIFISHFCQIIFPHRIMFKLFRLPS